MKYLSVFLYLFVAVHVVAHPFDTLYPMTPSTQVIQSLMHAWEDVQDLQNKESMTMQEYEYACCALIGKLVYIYDVIQNSVCTDKQTFSPDTIAYCDHIVQCMQKDAQKIKNHGNDVLYARLVKQLNKIMKVMDSME